MSTETLMSTRTETALAARMVSDVVEALGAALTGWHEMQVRSAAEGLDTDAEAARVALAIDRARKLLG